MDVFGLRKKICFQKLMCLLLKGNFPCFFLQARGKSLALFSTSMEPVISRGISSISEFL